MAIPLRKDFQGNRMGFTKSLSSILDILGINGLSSDTFAQSIPFTPNDTTAGSENEFQTVVIGKRGDVDLAIAIQESGYYQSMIKRFRAGETSKKALQEVEKYLQDNPDQIWENSWVRFPRKLMSRHTYKVLLKDLQADKRNSDGPQRSDLDKFIFNKDGEEWLRVPVSYLLKLALLEALYADPWIHSSVMETGKQVMEHFLNDNTSPETYSFAPVLLNVSSGMGKGLARETLKRYLLTQLLILYANRHFQLTANGQRVILYFAPHPPVRQKMLNNMISDAFYRELFMNPCLSGWTQGEAKFLYMNLCHQVLSRSQLNIIPKLKESGIIVNNLVVLPNLSNISLANNGTHISLGSRKLTDLLADPDSGFGEADEKHLGDLAIKIIEHFLPLFVGIYSAAPYRLDFEDFHPEKALGFLPHELDYTHLRMIWRRWTKKADLKILGQPITPFGPRWLDVLFSRVFSLKGDFVQDFRLIDYPVALLSTDQSPALDGTLGNADRLKKDLAALGVFDAGMSLYLLCRLRTFSQMGFTGFEGRHYSLFESLMDDMGQAASLQTLITALAYKYILTGEVTHASIPDTPTIESERRQIFFGSAIDIPTFFVRKNTSNRFMTKILEKTDRTRLSRRYPGYVRVYHFNFRKALIRTIEKDGADLIELMGLGDILRELKARVENWKALSVSGKLTRGILSGTRASTPKNLSAREFNQTAEKFYREDLRKRHIYEALTVLEEDLMKIDSRAVSDDPFFHAGLINVLERRTSPQAACNEITEEKVPEEFLRQLIHLTLLSIDNDKKQYTLEKRKSEKYDEKVIASVY